MADIVMLPASPPAAPAPSQGPPVLSFPAILRNPGLTNRFAHLQGGLKDRDGPKRSYGATAPSKKRDQNDGKRWLRRKDNAHFVGNPHIVAATKRDMGIAPPDVRSTFPEPLPPFLPRTVKLPAATAPRAPDPASANAGRFSLSLKGMRKELKRQGGRAEALVKDIEGELLSWLGQGGTVLYPDSNFGRVGVNAAHAGVQGTPVGETGVVVEVSRTPLQLVWRIPEDAFARYVVHCCARYHEIVSFSKGTGEERLTYLLRPNVTRPDHHARGALDTPPTTDLDYHSNTESNIDSDFISDRDFESDVEPPPSSPALSRIDEPLREDVDSDVDSWSLLGDADVESGSELEPIEVAVGSLTLDAPQNAGETDEDPDRTMTSPQLRPSHRPYPLSASSRRMLRSASSPSRSPVRVRPGRRRGGLGNAMARANSGPNFKRTLYEYIFM
ncbi:hypothetical protein D9611_003856 [Ephemerocybe angulata]|uniref:Uncharacterized protein n=1 Tax=Ephemerocybe angulata TaxID=980116 RepID=A0A8H5EY52_9AGAR|nr:hypothetical protein D9611_003856 [Tulosesus angulatus]